MGRGKIKEAEGEARGLQDFDTKALRQDISSPPRAP